MAENKEGEGEGDGGGEGVGERKIWCCDRTYASAAVQFSNAKLQSSSS